MIKIKAEFSLNVEDTIICTTIKMTIEQIIIAAKESLKENENLEDFIKILEEMCEDYK